MISLRTIDDQARALQKVLSQYGYTSDPDLVSQRVATLHDGLVHEDEFLYVLNWSKRVILAHKLEQTIIPPEAKVKFRIPDLCMVIDQDGQQKSYLVEIKTTKDNELKWTKNYFQGLHNYSQQMGIPMLVAWKWKSFDIWTLVRLEDFEQADPDASFRLPLDTAYKRNLMSNLLGDFVAWLPEQFSLVLKQKKVKEINEDGRLGWETIVEDVYFTGRDGQHLPIDDGVLAVLHSVGTEEITEEDEQYLYFKLIPAPNRSLFIQTIPIRLNERLTEKQVHWQELISEGKFPIDYESLLKSLKTGIESGLVDHILFTIPNYQ